jgi:RNA polymerase sigma factor (sigma-70 family)
VILEMNRTKLTDTELVSSYRRGNEASFAELVSKYQSKVYTTIFLIVKDRYLAEDLTQDVFIKAINKIMADKYNEEGKFGPWIGRIAHNIAIDFFRKSKRSKEIVTEDGSPLFSNMDFIEDSFEDIQIKMETNAKVRVLIETLPENQKEVLVMRHYADMSFHEIAEQTGVSINTALGRYALINLRKKFEETEKAYDNKPYPN